MKANRLYATALAVLVGVALAACGGSDTSELETDNSELPTLEKRAPTERETARDQRRQNRGGGTDATVYVSDSNGAYHKADCGRVKADDLSGPASAAMAAGYKPCPKCKPPQPSQRAVQQRTQQPQQQPRSATSGGHRAQRPQRQQRQPQQQPQTRQRPQAANDPTVYVTRTGKKYHSAGCQYLSKSKIAKPLSQARRSCGPCSKCSPPR